MKRCSACHEEKSFSDFHKAKSEADGYYCYCKPCRAEKRKEDWKTNPVRREKNKDNCRKYAAANPSYNVRALRKSRYDITEAEWTAMFARQGGRCAACGVDNPHDSPKGTWHTDHMKGTKIVRGILCGRCNMGLGLLCEDGDRLRKLAAYADYCATLRGHA